MDWYHSTISSNPTIQNKVKLVIKNIENFDIGLLDALQNYIISHQGKDTKYYVEHIDFHDFTIESFNYLMHQINTYRNTYHGIGPFMCDNELWYINKDNKNLKDIIEQQQRIIESQKKELERLKPKSYYDLKEEVQ